MANKRESKIAGTPSEPVTADIDNGIEDSCRKIVATLPRDHLLKQLLKPEMFEELKNRKTRLGMTLRDVFELGARPAKLGYSFDGFYAPDSESYAVFRPLFDGLVHEYNKTFDAGSQQPAPDFGESRLSELAILDPQYVLSTRIRVCRSFSEFSFCAFQTEQPLNEIDAKMRQVLNGIDDAGFRGDYYSLEKMDAATKEGLIKTRILFKDGDGKMLRAVDGYRHWPMSRSLFLNQDKSFVVWVNEEDHVRMISMETGGNIGSVWTRLVNGIKLVELKLKEANAVFARDDVLGYLNFCPTNLGCTVRASVHLKIPSCIDSPEGDKILKTFHLQKRGVGGEDTDPDFDGDISNKIRLGITEFEAVKMMHDGVQALIELEKNLANK